MISAGKLSFLLGIGALLLCMVKNTHAHTGRSFRHVQEESRKEIYQEDIFTIETLKQYFYHQEK